MIERDQDKRQQAHGADEDAPSFRVTDRRFWANPGVPKEPRKQAAPQRGPGPVEELQQALQVKDAMLQQAKSAIVHLQQEITQIKGRVEKEKLREIAHAKGQLVRPLLELADNLERSLAAVDENTVVASLVEGVTLIQQQLVGLLKNLGVVSIDPLGQRFDPAEHEALMTSAANGDDDDGKVSQVYKRGYKYGDQLLRPAQVVVARRQ